MRLSIFKLSVIVWGLLSVITVTGQQAGYNRQVTLRTHINHHNFGAIGIYNAPFLDGLGIHLSYTRNKGNFGFEHQFSYSETGEINLEEFIRRSVYDTILFQQVSAMRTYGFTFNLHYSPFKLAPWNMAFIAGFGAGKLTVSPFIYQGWDASTISLRNHYFEGISTLFIHMNYGLEVRYPLNEHFAISAHVFQRLKIFLNSIEEWQDIDNKNPKTLYFEKEMQPGLGLTYTF
ncbi:MAG: hypothetical protein K9I34_05485 [Bacteroidales bacterium]|nr:hypothetical protein [Bacteroidales bacterium]